MVLIAKHALFKCCILVLLSICVVQDMPKTLKKRIDKTLKGHFDTELVQMEPIIIPEDLSNKLPESFLTERLFRLINDDNELGYAYVGKAPSLSEYFDFMVIFNRDLMVVHSKVLIYREDYGGEIGSKRWLRQFEGASPGQAFIINHDIMAISGATISVNAMTLAINELLDCFKTLSENNVL